MSCEPMAPDDRPAVLALLAGCGLPIEDVRDEPGSSQFVWREQGGIVGTVGVDLAENVALLRSLAVAAPRRGCGLGSALLAAAEAHAAACGARTLVLLTTTADGLVQRRGFTPVSRCELGDAVRAFRQFSAGCCADARCYRRDSEGGAS